MTMDNLNSAIGTSLPTFDVEVERGRLRLFAEAIGERDPVFRDEMAARAAGHPDVPAPPTSLFGFLLERPDATRWLDDLGIELGHVLHAGQTFVYHATAYAGDVLTFRPMIVDAFEKKGGALQFLVRKTSVTRADGAPVVDLTDTIAVVNSTSTTEA